MKNRQSILGDLRRTMDVFVGQVFTEDMRQRIRMDATELMNAAYDEGQAAMAPHICANQGTSYCPQTESGFTIEEYDPSICRKCNLEGGFSI